MSTQPQNEYNGETIETQETPMHICKPSPPGANLIDNPAELAAAFANVVTTPSEMAHDWVARNGDKSIFTAFRIVLPEVSNPPQYSQCRLGCEGACWHGS